MIKAIEKGGCFHAPSSFARTKKLAGEVIDYGVKMGEGWLLTGEMMALIDEGVNNIVRTQPFGCLPNHVRPRHDAAYQKHPSRRQYRSHRL